MKIKNLKEFTLFSKVKERLYNAFGVEKKEQKHKTSFVINGKISVQNIFKSG